MTDDSRSILNLSFEDHRQKFEEPRLRAFLEEVYAPSVPDPREATRCQAWIERLRPTDSEAGQSSLHLVVARGGPDGQRMCGGFAVEFFPASGCGLLSYLVVADDQRRRGLGRRLVSEATALLHRCAAAHMAGMTGSGGPAPGQSGLRAVFAELEDPRRVQPTGGYLAPWDRLAFFETVGARAIDLWYTRPIGTDEPPRQDQLLSVLPVGNYVPDSISRELVDDFLCSYYDSRCAEPRNEEWLQRMRVDLVKPVNPRETAPRAETQDTVALITFRPERPALKLTRASIALHFVEPFVGDEKLLRAELTPAPAFESFERDILAYAHRDEQRPFASHVDKRLHPGGKSIKLHFPAETSFVTEGQTTRVWCANQDPSQPLDWTPQPDIPPPGQRTIELRLLCSKTTFQSNQEVFHLVLVADAEEGSALNEYDLTKIVKLCEGGEVSHINEKIRCSIEGNPPEWFHEFSHTALCGAFDGFPEVCTSEADKLICRPGAATIQIQTGSDEHAQQWSTIYRCLNDLASDRSEGMRELEELMSADRWTDGRPSTGARIVAVGGILQGLLDFERVDPWELTDVLEPIDSSERYLLYLQKGVLLNIVDRDRTTQVEACRSWIGCNPYLMGAHGVLLHNDEVLRTVHDTLPQQMDDLSIGALKNRRKEVDDSLKRKFLPNVFHYPTERKVYDRGHQELGLDAKRTMLESRLEHLVDAIAGREQKVIGLMQVILAIIFGIVSLASLWQVTDAAIKFVRQAQGQTEALATIDRFPVVLPDTAATLPDKLLLTNVQTAEPLLPALFFGLVLLILLVVTLLARRNLRF